MRSDSSGVCELDSHKGTLKLGDVAVDFKAFPTFVDLEVDDFSDAFLNFEVDGFAAFPAVVLARGWGLMNFVKLGPPAIWKMKTKCYQCSLYQLQEPPYAKEKKT